MDFLYPKFINPTHLTKKINIKNTDKYPTSQITGTLYSLEVGTKICVMEEYVGKNFNVARVKIIDEKYSDRAFFQKEIYVYQSDLVIFDTSKKSLVPFKNSRNLVKNGVSAETYETKIAAIPFVDESLGMLCVKVMTEYERAVDMVFFDNLVKSAAREGARILLDSRGLISDDQTIKSFMDEYFTFVYVLKADNLTNLRPCSNIDFIVGIPLRFLNNVEVNTSEYVFDESAVQYRLSLTSRKLLDKTEKILQGLSSRTTEYYNFLYPDQFTPGFVLNYDLMAVKEFVASLTDLMDFYQKPLRNDNPFDFELAYDKNLNLQFIKINDEREEYVPKSILDTFTYRSSFTSKRVINYFLNADNLFLDSKKMSLLDFLNKYVKYPDIEFKKVEFKLANGEALSKQETDSFISARAKNSESCVSLANAISDVAFSNPAYHFFWNEFGGKEATPEPTLNEIIKATEEKAADDKLKGQFDAARGAGVFAAFKGISYKTVASATGEGITQAFQTSDYNGLGKGYTQSLTLNALLNIGKRINLYDYVIRKLICELKKSNSTDSREIAEIIEKVGPDLWNYIIYVSQIQSDPGSKSFYQQAIRGLTAFDDLAAINFCTSNKFVVVFLKLLKAINITENVEFVKGLVGQNIVDGLKTKLLDSARKAFNPKPQTSLYQDLIKQLTGNIINVTIDISLNALKDYLQADASCLSDILDSNNNQYKNPLDTHRSINGYGGSKDNDPNIVRQDRTNALEDSLRITSRGIDLEQTVDLISSLLDTMQCILTPLEIADLLDGNPSAESLSIVKSIIIGKYLPDLNYLLEGNNITLLLSELGKRVNPDAVQQVRDLFEETTSTTGFLDIRNNQYSPSLLCTPQQFIQYREEILKNKIPKDIANDVLQRKNKKILGDINRVLQGPNLDEIPLSALCPAGSAATDSSLFSKLLENNNEFIDTALSKLLTQFNEESNLVSSKYIEKKNLYMRDDSGRIARTVPYTKIFENLVLNLSPLTFQNKLANLTEESKIEIINTLGIFKQYSTIPNQEVIDKVSGLISQNYTRTDDTLTLRYYNRQAYLDINSLVSMLLQGQRSNTQSECGDERQTVELDKSISDNILSGNIPFFFEHIKPGESDMAFEESTLGDFYTKNDAGINEYDLRIAQRLRSVDYFTTITFDDEFYDNDSQRYTFNIWFNDKNASTFKNVASETYEDGGEPTNSTDDDQIESILSNYPVIDTGFSIYGDVGIFKDIISSDKKYVKKLANKYKSFLNKNKSSIENILKFKELQEILNRLNSKPVYEVVLKDNKNGTFTLTVNYKQANDKQVITTQYFNITLNGSINTQNIDINSLSDIFNSGLLVKRNIDIFDTITQDRTNGRVLYFDTSYWGDSDPTEQQNYVRQARLGNVSLDDIEYENGLLDISLYDVIKDTSKYEISYDDTRTNLFISSVSLDLTNKTTDVERACGLIQHYLNPRVLKQDAFEDVKDVFCSDGPVSDAFNDALKRIIVLLTMRTFTADILMKAYLFFSNLNAETRRSLYKDSRFVETVRKYVISELSSFSKNYSNSILDEARVLFDKLSDETIGRNSGFIFDQSNDKKVDYWISKEINYYFKHSNYLFENVDKKIQFGNDDLAKQVLARKNAKGLVNIFDNIGEYVLFHYILMASQVEPAKRDIYISSKSTLVNLFSSFFKREDENFKEFLAQPSDTELTDFIKAVANSPNPAALIATKPGFNRYTNFLLKAIYNTTKKTIQTIARNQDPNMFITKNILDSLNIGYGIYYSTLTQKDLEDIMCTNPNVALLNKMYEKGEYIIPYIFPITSASLVFAGLPYLSLLPYIDLTLSTIETTKNLSEANTEIENFRKHKLLRIAKSYLPEDRYAYYANGDFYNFFAGDGAEQLKEELKTYGVEFEDCDPCGNIIPLKDGTSRQNELIAVCTPEEKQRILQREVNKEFEGL